MQTDENAVIRYLMKEMDPSEEVLMERAMMEDDDLLIEVESMRQTLQRLDDLPDKEPPAELTESIVQQAADHKKQTSSWPSIPKDFYKYAAVLIIGMGMGSGLLMFMDSPSTGETVKSEVGLSASMQNVQNVSNADTEPWVDRDDVIYFQDMFNPESEGYNAIMQTSTQQLTPVNDQSLQFNAGPRNIQLTGSGN